MAKLNWQIVDRYLAGEATAAERALVERWLAEVPALRMLISKVQQDDLDDETVRRAQAEVRGRLDRDLAFGRPADRPRHRRLSRELVTAIRSRGVGVLKAAAAVAVLIGGGLLVRQTLQVVNHAEVALRTVTAGSRRQSVSLPDGSKVILSPRSTLRYSTSFASDMRRDVRLDGEAYFDVRHDSRRPFVVRAGDLVADDIGTQFVVRAYPEDKHGQVVVREGLVGVAGAVVSPGELGRMSDQGQPIVEPVNAASWFAWTEGRLAFEGMPLRDALPALSRWYDLDFRLADPALGDKVVVATLPEMRSDDALDAVALALGMRLVREGRVVTFQSLTP